MSRPSGITSNIGHLAHMWETKAMGENKLVGSITLINLSVEVYNVSNYVCT
jgi:hypothetical protein